MDLTPNDIASVDVGYWATLFRIRLQASTFSFIDHEYQIEPMCFRGRRKCVMKGTQGGFTEDEVLDSLHGMIYKHLPQGVLYLFPTTDDVGEFSKSRFNPLIVDNREAIGQYVKTAAKGTDTASLKKIHNAFLYLRGARLSQKISDMNESSKLKSIPVDRVVFDEVDHMDADVIAKALGRMGHSKIKQERYLSNPIVPGEGIDRIFSKSDQRQWFRKCRYCGKEPYANSTFDWYADPKNGWTCAELYFMEDPEKCVGIRDDGTGFISCKNCGKELLIDWKDNDIYTSNWVPQAPSNTDYMQGYQWSQLSSAFNDPAEILRDFREPPENNLADVYRLRLGLPYIAAEDRLTLAEVYNCCNNDGMYPNHSGPCAMGIDVGIVKHIVIGIRLNNKQYQILKVIQLSDWNDIHDLARKFNIKSAVIDIRPYQDTVKKFQIDEPYQIFLCEYSNNPAYTRTWDIKRGIVKDYRTALFDETHRMAITPGMLTIPRRSPEIEEFAKQMCNAYKLLETHKKTGAKEYRYKGDKEHYRNALNYFLLAALRSRPARADGSSIKHEQTDVISEYVRI